MRNEEHELPGLLDALERLDLPSQQHIHVCILLDGCTDRSGRIATAYRATSRYAVSLDHAAPAESNAGRARRDAMSLGMAALDGADGLLLTTDADSRPAATWLTAMAAALWLADVVAGRILRRGDRPSPLQDRLETYYDALFRLRRRLDPVPWEAALTHHCSGGANLGVRAAAYCALGGFAPVCSGEDARLLDDAARAGLRVRHDAASVVHTSDRRTGRVAGGLAGALRHLDAASPTTLLVTHPADAAWQYRMQAAARVAFAEHCPERIAAAIGLGGAHVIGVARDCPNAEAFAMRVVPTAPGGMRDVPLPVAEIALADLANDRCAA